MKKKFAAVAAIAMLLVMLCMTASAESEGATKTVSENGVSITVATDKAEYQAGEEVNYTITVENTTQLWIINAASFNYNNSNGLVPVSDDSMPNEFPAIQPGESYVISGKLIGSEDVFGAAGTQAAPGSVAEPGTTSGNTGLIIAVAAAAVVVIAAVALIVRKNGRGGKNGGGKAAKTVAKMLILTIIGGTLVCGTPAKAAEYEEMSIRPYLSFTYAGQDVMIRATMNLKILQKPVSIPGDSQSNAKKITCHDPSIFKDFDGTYYILGSFLCGGYTEDLRNWTSIDAEFQASFTQEVRDQIKAWNDDDTADGWNGYLWAPDVVYNPIMGKYCMYLSANGDDWKSNIVLLTADAVDGPYDYVGTIVYGGFNAEDYGETDAPMVTGEAEIPERYVTKGVDNKLWGDKWPNCIDPCVFYDDDGNLWMSYGSWSGGIFMLELDEETGLRDYHVTYENNDHSDAYFGKKIAGGWYSSGEASYIQKVGDYYYLFISYGGLTATGGYNIRVFRSENPDGDYVDALGNSAFYDKLVLNFNDPVGVRLFGGYKWRTFTYGEVAQGHNSAFVDDDGKAYIVFHTRTTNGTEGHYVKVHQLFTTKEGWLVAAPYATSGETLNEEGYSMAQVAGNYEMIIHNINVDYQNLGTNKPVYITLSEDGRITGDYEGTWSLEAGTPYITLNFNDKEYSGLTLEMNVENSTIETMVFTALGIDDQITVWGSRQWE